MNKNIILSRLQDHFPALCPALPSVPVSAYRLIEAPAGTRIFDVGGSCEHYLLLTSGRVSVKMLSNIGKSLLLYHVLPGQSCIITTSCLLGKAQYPTFAQADTDIEALGIPRVPFGQALDQSEIFRSFVFDGLGQRLADLMHRIETVNYRSIESRLASALLVRGDETPLLRITHEILAEEVGTAREVISRRLKALEDRGILSLERGAIVIHDNNTLRLLEEDL